MTIIKTTTTLMSKSAAIKLAAFLNAEAKDEGDAWTYKVSCGVRLFTVEIYDEEGVYIGNL